MLTDVEGRPLRSDQEKRREMTSGQKKKTPYGEVVFRLSVDLPKSMPEDDFKKLMREYGAIINEAFK
jgi:hypothetical protein